MKLANDYIQQNKERFLDMGIGSHGATRQHSSTAAKPARARLGQQLRTPIQIL